ncbi:MAG: transglutaminase family protein, partial [Bacteroidota bacterium]
LDTPNTSIKWEDFKEEIGEGQFGYLELKQFTLFSPLVPFISSLKDYISKSFSANRSLFHALEEVNHRIYQDFEYDSGFTTIATPLDKVAEAKKGVCQDFAHIAISGLRAMGIPTRYVSGYIETLPPEGAPELVGSAASHAWFSSYIPGMGWVDFDPTNNQIVKDQHITIAWGRDYADVPPLKGVIRNSGSHELSVEVEVIRI